MASVTPHGKLTILLTKPRSISSNHSTKSTSTSRNPPFTFPLGQACCKMVVTGANHLSTRLMVIFCTSRGAMCAGSAQVTLVELRKSCYPGCNPSETKTNQKTPKTTHKKPETPGREQPATQLIEPCRQSEEGETGATNSARRSVVLVPQRSLNDHTCK